MEAHKGTHLSILAWLPRGPYDHPVSWKQEWTGEQGKMKEG